jgi:hypothetical protein
MTRMTLIFADKKSLSAKISVISVICVICVLYLPYAQ